MIIGSVSYVHGNECECGTCALGVSRARVQ